MEILPQIILLYLFQKKEHLPVKKILGLILCNDCIKSFFNWIDSANLVNQDLEWETPQRKLDEDFVKEMYNRVY